MVLWSRLGAREQFEGTSAVVFSTGAGSVRLLVAQWIAGVILAAAAGVGPGLRAAAQSPNHFEHWLAAIALIASLAVCCGVWSGTPRLFEAVYGLLWYMGPVNAIGTFDFIGGSPHAVHPAYIFMWAAVLIGTAIARRYHLLELRFHRAA